VSNLDSRDIRIEDLHSGYEAIPVIFGISLHLPANGTVAIVGRNGAGKTTLLQTIMGYVPISGGNIFVGERRINSLTPSQRVKLGVGYVPQEGPVFSNLTVKENLIIGTSVLPRQERNNIDSVLELFPKLAARLNQKAGTMSGGERKMVGIARALLGQPQLLIMDEPTEGVWHGVVDEIRDRLVEYAKDHTILIVEQNLDFALSFAKEIHLLERGVITRKALSSNAQDVESLRQKLTI
jgi:branched-chain amino acid transport system ATP-binding protein